MTLDNLDTYLKNYLNFLRDTHTLKGLGEVRYRISKSKISKSIYVKLTYKIDKHCYRKTVRISDHVFNDHDVYRRSLTCLTLEEHKYNKKQIKLIKATVRKAIARLIYNASQHAIKNFKASDH